MCGITGWVSFDRDLMRERDTLEAMTRTMACRGPDAEGIWFDGPAALGHRRLAVIDIAGGTQPMSVSTPTGDVALVYSGEAYNYVELREELRRAGESFETSSDTEVVLRGYLRWGDAVADLLNGMFAFAIWDAREQKLVLIRDRLGIKPLYFHRTPDGAMFGSEPKAILANPLAPRVVDADGLRELFAFARSPRRSVWSGIREVEPGTIVSIDARGVRERTYWRLETRPHTDDRDATVGHVRELLDDIVRRQLVADVPRCVLLSGGLDSSTITALAAAQLAEEGERVRSFAVDFVGQTEHFRPDPLRSTPDTPYVHDVARHVGSEHADIVLDHTMLADPRTRRAALVARDMPLGLGDMDTSLYLLCKAIRERSTVALSGESADEIFGGYRQFHDPAVQRAHAFPWLAMNMRQFGESNTMLHEGVRLTLDLEGYRREAYESAIAEIGHLDSESDLEYRMRISSYLHLTRFLPMLLDRKDRMSMAVGLEVRVPFCDHRLVEYVYNAPWALKSYDGREKSLLRGAARDVLPKSILQRVKSPYPSTQDPHYSGAIQAQAAELLADSGHAVFDLVNPVWVREAVGEDPARITQAARHQLERTLDLAGWLDIYRPRIEWPATSVLGTERGRRAA